MIETSRYNNKIKLKLLSRKKENDKGCWNYQGIILKNGYGQVGYLGGQELVHRLSLKLFKPEEFKAYLKVLHKCDNPSCFNPDHLYSGTQCDNQQDAVKRGRHWETAKTQCPQGHEFTKDNTYISPKSGGRECIICRTARSRFRAAVLAFIK